MQPPNINHSAKDSETMTIAPTADRQSVIATAQRRLYESGYPSLRRVCCEFDGAQITLSGRVSSFHQKQIAQTLVRQVAQVQRVINQLYVVSYRGFSQ